MTHPQKGSYCNNKCIYYYWEILYKGSRECGWDTTLSRSMNYGYAEIVYYKITRSHKKFVITRLVLWRDDQQNFMTVVRRSVNVTRVYLRELRTAHRTDVTLVVYKMIHHYLMLFFQKNKLFCNTPDMLSGFFVFGDCMSNTHVTNVHRQIFTPIKRFGTSYSPVCSQSCISSHVVISPPRNRYVYTDLDQTAVKNAFQWLVGVGSIIFVTT